MNYIPASELERIVLERRSPSLLGVPLSIYLNELCHAPFSSPVAATRAAMQKVQEMAGATPLPWYNDETYASERSVCDSHELRASIFCFPMPLFPHPSESAKNPEFVCGWIGTILISAWRPLKATEREPKPGDVWRWIGVNGQWRYTTLEPKDNGRYTVYVSGNPVEWCHSELSHLEYVGTIKPAEEATSGS